MFSVCMRDCYDACSMMSELKEGVLRVKADLLPTMQSKAFTRLNILLETVGPNIAASWSI